MKNFLILLPVYNDWKSAYKLLNEIDLQILNCESEISILIVNDASTEIRFNMNLSFKKIKSVRIINMKKNLGHARCYAAGLKFIIEKDNFDYVIPMDADGEDRPEELNLFFKKSEEYPDKVITADRISRSEGFFFKFCYWIHKYFTFIFTGHLIKFGNYSCLPRRVVSKIVEEPSTWSSFSGTITKLIPDKISIPSTRSVRYYGPSKMSFFNLLIHSFSIITVFKRTVFLRSFIFLFVYFFLIFENLSLVTLFPVLLIIALLLSVTLLSNRENLTQYKKSLDNISSIDSFN